MKDLIRAGSWNAFSTVTRACGLIFLAHIIAVYTGPAGMGLVGQFSSVVSILFVFAGGGFGHGVIRTIGVDPLHQLEIRRTLRAGAAIAAMSSLGMLLVCLFGARFLSAIIFGNESYAWVMRIVGCAQIIMSVYNLMMPVYSGYRRPDILFLHYVIGTIVGAGLSVAIVRSLGIDGALTAVIVYQVSAALALIAVSIRLFPISFSALVPSFDLEKIKYLSQYSLMALTTAIIAPLTSLFIRRYIETRLGWESVGYWQATLRISDAYIMLVVMILTTHYLPALSAARSAKELQNETKKLLTGILPMGGLAAALIYLFRGFIIRTLFTKSFAIAGDYIGLQVLIDLLRSTSWAFSYIYLAKGHRNYYIFSEILCAIGITLMVDPLLSRFGLAGAFYATLLGTTAYLMFSIGSYFILTKKIES